MKKDTSTYFRVPPSPDLTHVDGDQKSSARQFLDWLISERAAGKYYTCIAHNGSRFDFYILRASMTQQELLHADIYLEAS